MIIWLRLLSLITCLLLETLPLYAQDPEQIQWAQLSLPVSRPLEETPYANVHQEIFQFLTQTTSIKINPQKKVLKLKEDTLFETPFVILAGREAPPDLEDEEIHRLRNYLLSGGFLWIEDTSGQKSSSFNPWIHRMLRMTLPDAPLQTLPPHHVLFKTFYLIRTLGGRAMVEPSLQGISWGKRLVVVYSRNDLLGAWIKDNLGNPLFPCIPRGEAQRWDAKKMTVNILFYALTGNYKEDAVHQPYILQKMRAEPIPH